MDYILIGDPKAWASPRFGRGRVYDELAKLKLVLGLNLRNQHGNLPPFMGPLELQVTFYVAIPQRMSKKKRDKIVNSPAAVKPDTDNMVKLLGDLGQRAGLYYNDLQICRIFAQKLYTDLEARTEFSLLEIRL